MQRPHIPTAREIMTSRLHTIPLDSGLESAVQELLEKGHSGAPVVDASGSLVGVLSEYDCMGVLAQAALEGWPTSSVAERMTKKVETVSPKDDVFSLASRFSADHHRRLLVVDESGKLVGLISRGDLLRALADLVNARGRPDRQTTYQALERRHIRLD